MLLHPERRLRARLAADDFAALAAGFDARELFWEGHRRTDLIRFDRFTGGTEATITGALLLALMSERGAACAAEALARPHMNRIAIGRGMA